MRLQSQKKVWPALILILMSIFFWAARTFWIGAPYNSEGFGPLGNAIYAISLTSFILILSGGLGYRLLRLFPELIWTDVELFCLSIAFGLGILAYAILCMGLTGLLQPVHILFLLLIVCVITQNEIKYFVNTLFKILRNLSTTLSEASFSTRVLFGLATGAFGLTLFQSLTPPFNYDALMYHLQGPRLFLEAGKIVPIFDNWLTFYPFTVEMINLLGMALGSDILARLIHCTSLLLILLSTNALGKRILPNYGAILATGILSGIPVLYLWSSQANNDLTLVLFQFLAIFLFLLWIQQNKSGFLILAGVLQGFALGIKYLAFSGSAILVIAIWINCWENSNKKSAIIKAIKSSVIFGGTTLLIASPWYLKNLIWTGNPIFPFFMPSRYVDPLQLNLWTHYMGTYGTGKQWIDYLLLPINLFIKPGSFSTWFGVIDIPSPLFIFAVSYPFVIQKTSQENKKLLHFLAFITFIQFIVWAAGSQQTRFLFPIYPGLSILSCCFLLWAINKFRYGQRIINSIMIGFLIISLVIISAATSVINPTKLFTGQETKSQFLSQRTGDYSAIKFIMNNLPPDSRVLLLWDGQSYYCDERCVPDLFQSFWASTFFKNNTNKEIVKDLFSNNINYILYNQTDIDFFLAHDYLQYNRQSVEYFDKIFAPNCVKIIYQDQNAKILALYSENNNCK